MNVSVKLSRWEAAWTRSSSWYMFMLLLELETQLIAAHRHILCLMILSKLQRSNMRIGIVIVSFLTNILYFPSTSNDTLYIIWCAHFCSSTKQHHVLVLNEYLSFSTATEAKRCCHNHKQHHETYRRVEPERSVVDVVDVDLVYSPSEIWLLEMR